MSEENGYIDADDRIGLPDEMDESRPLITSKGLKAIQELYGDKDLPGRPQPPVPRNLDLRDMPSMLLDVARLRNSAVARTPNAEAFRAAVMLWCASWHEIPASSLPNNDLDLCHLAGFGRDQVAWQAIREQALHGYYECADGRLYHSVVAEKALDAAVKRNNYHDKMEKARAALAAKRALMGETAKATIKETIKVPMIEALTGHKETKGKERNTVTKTETLPTTRAVADATRTEAGTKFDQFWSDDKLAQARGDAVNPKKPARDKFINLVFGGENPDEIFQGWRRCAAALQRSGKYGTQYSPQFIVFLNQRRWEDNYASNGAVNGRQNNGSSAIAAAERLKERFGGASAAAAYVPGSAGPTISLDYGTGPADPKRLPKG